MVLVSYIPYSCIRTCGRERVTRPHLGVASAVRCAVLDFRTGNPCRNRSRMAKNPWKMSSERQRIAGSGSYVDNNSTPTIAPNLMQEKTFLSLQTSCQGAQRSVPLLCATIGHTSSSYARQSLLSTTIPHATLLWRHPQKRVPPKRALRPAVQSCPGWP